MTTAKSTKKSSSVDKSVTKAEDALAMLRADHDAVSKMFVEYEKSRTSTRKKELINEICMALSIHAQIEEEIFYPAVKASLNDKILVPEAMIEHATLKDLIGQLEVGEDDSEMVDARVKVLSEYVKHHVKEEQDEMFPKVKASSLNTADLGAQMAARRDDLMALSH